MALLLKQATTGHVTYQRVFLEWNNVEGKTKKLESNSLLFKTATLQPLNVTEVRASL